MSEIEYSDRYTALGITPPPPSRVCQGQCEGTGWVPVYMKAGDSRRQHGTAQAAEEDDQALIRLWQEAEATQAADDGWHFVRCPTCGGTGVRA